jgi:heat shock protein HtpX
VAGLILGVVLAVAVGLVVGLVALVGVTAAVAVALMTASPGWVTRSLHGRPCDEEDQARLLNVVDGLCATLGLPAPAVVVVESPLPNAMAIGRKPDDAVLVVTSGLEPALSLVQLEGVLAHELVHVKRHDIVVSGPAVAVATLCSLVLGVTRAADLVHRWVGPGREFEADQRAAQAVRYPPGLEGALEAMAAGNGAGEWPPVAGRTAALTRWLWIDPGAHDMGPNGPIGNLDDTGVRAAALALR